MAKVDIARALKDRTYFNGLSDEEKAQVRAADPSGQMGVTDDDLDLVSGGLSERLAAITGTSTTCGTKPGGDVSIDQSSEPTDPQSCNCNC